MNDWRSRARARFLAAWRSPFWRGFGFSCGAAAGYGGWAAYANAAHGFTASAWAAGTQGGVSFLTTAGMVTLMEALARTASTPGGKLVRSFGGAMVVSVGGTVGAHVAAGTPELLATVAPSLLLGGGFSLAYCLNLAREARTVGESPEVEDASA